jgi:DNA-directed RNA polymerase specialized sigma24 family protein
VSRARWDSLLRVYHRHLPRPDLEDCLQQATLELVVQARRGSIPADTRLIAGALEHKFKSRIIDRHRAVAGRSPEIAAHAHATPLDALGETLPGHHDTAQTVIAHDELRRITSRLRDLTPDQRLVLANQTFIHRTPADFCEHHGWSLEKYRKVAQRGRARLDHLLQHPDQRREQPHTTTQRTSTTTPRYADPPGRDPLAPHRRVLGADRSDQLSALAQAAAPRAAAQTRPALLAERDAAVELPSNRV